MTPNTPIVRSGGLNAAEAYLGELCQHAFLSLWSYPNVYRARNRELCDLLVVFGDDVIIFSDKFSPFQAHTSVELAWARWFKRSLWASARQLWRAVGWIREHPGELYLDPACSRPFPFELAGKPLHVHLVAVAHGSARAVRDHWGDSGSLMVDSSVRGRAAHGQPFTVGDLDPGRPFIHVLDDESLLTLIRHRDTIRDFLAYLEKRERLMRGPTIVMATGEEELLAIYLTKCNQNNEHDFVFPVEAGEQFTSIAVDQGYWEDFKASQAYAAQRERDAVSYLWDELIEEFARHALQGTQHFVSEGGFHDSETILRFMAGEPRLVRRAYAEHLEEMFRTTPATGRRIRILTPLLPGHPFYVVLLLPVPAGRPYEEYREVRRQLLSLCCEIVRLNFPAAQDIVGIAMEPVSEAGGSEDSCYFDARGWTPEREAEVRKLQDELGILKNPTITSTKTQEYPAQTG